MKVFFKKDVPGVGKANEVKNVSDGYARNYLIPKGLAEPATEGRMQAAKDYAMSKKDHLSRERARSEKIAEQLKATPLHFTAKAGDMGHLYGSITSADIAEEIERRLGVRLDKREIVLERHLRQIGVYDVEVRLPGGVHGVIKVTVEAEP